MLDQCSLWPSWVSFQIKATLSIMSVKCTLISATTWEFRLKKGLVDPYLSKRARRDSFSFTILASGDNKPWQGSRLPGDTCCNTDWLLPWWLMVVEEVTSLVPCWLYLSSRSKNTRNTSVMLSTVNALTTKMCDLLFCHSENGEKQRNLLVDTYWPDSVYLYLTSLCSCKCS